MLYKSIEQRGFTILELAISSMILVVIVIGLLYTYIACFELNEFSRNLTLANNALQAQLEFVRETSFDNLTDLDGITFNINGFADDNAIGVVDVYDTEDYAADLKYIRLSASWRQKSGRVIGEDVNLDGIIQSGEDLDEDGILDSPAELITLISRID